MDSYTQFSHFYDQLMGDRTDVIRLINKSIHAHAPEAQSLLELGSGTGSILEGLNPFFEVEGLDISSEMLKISQQKLPRIPHYLADMTEFDLGKRYDAVICVFDSINHLLTADNWRDTFAATARHLEDNGIFIFDTLTIGRLRAEIVMPTYHDELPSGIVDMDTDSIATNHVRHRIVFQAEQHDGAIQVYEQELDEVTFMLASIEEWLGQNFKIEESFTFDGSPVSDRAARVYYVCRKLTI